MNEDVVVFLILLDVDVIISKLFIVDISYIYKVGVIGLIVLNIGDESFLVFVFL